MRRRFVALGVIAAAAILLYLLLELHGRRARPPPRLVALAPAAITRIEARAAGWPQLVLARRGRRWIMRAPVAAPVAASRVEALIAALREPVARAYTNDRIDPAASGLRRPGLSVAVNRVRLEFGDVNSATLLRYVRRGATTLTVMDYVTPMLQQGPWQFVARRLLPAGSRLETIRLPHAVLARDHGGWRLRPASLDTASASNLASAWLAARARSVGPYSKDRGIKGPEIEVRLAGRPAPVLFVVQRRQSGTSLARPDLGLVYTLDPATARALLGGRAVQPAPGTTSAGTPGS